MARDVGVAAIIALMSMVLEMADAKADGARYAIGQVAENRQQHVSRASAED